MAQQPINPNDKILITNQVKSPNVKVYDLEKWVYPALSKFPKNQKTLSQRIEITSTRILEMVIDFTEKDIKKKRDVQMEKAVQMLILAGKQKADTKANTISFY